MMDIRDWPIDRIMQLPDCAFGRRWPIRLAKILEDGNAVFDLAEAALPERCVIWEVGFLTVGAFGVSAETGLSLGELLPTSEAQFRALELVFSGVDSPISGRGHFEVAADGWAGVMTLRQPMQPAGRRLVARFIRHRGSALSAGIIVVVSSIPTEVPDWLISGQGRSL